ncbi:MAG: GNAT family N-acetyltransferase [Solirubrobacteraceae bacterium]
MVLAQGGARGGHLERVGGTELVVTPGDGVIPFPRVDMNTEEVVDRIRILGLRNVGCWSLAPDSRLGTSLVARGFGWGWEPRWMGLDLRHLARDPPDHQVRAACAPYADELPYPPSGPEPVPSLHLGVRSDGLTVGHIVMAPWHGVAGIYSMGVDPGYRRHGIGRALTIAACRLAAERGCRYAVLNATDAGEPVYRKVGFESLGWGQTWWYVDGPRPSARQTALAEAIGTGDLDALPALQPTDEELESPLPGDTSPLRLALVTDRLETAGWLLERRPGLASLRFEPFGGTLLHLAVERNKPAFIELGLAHGVDPRARDGTWNSTGIEWAQHFKNAQIGELLTGR